jgi:hypothetical protein
MFVSFHCTAQARLAFGPGSLFGTPFQTLIVPLSTERKTALVYRGSEKNVRSGGTTADYWNGAVPEGVLDAGYRMPHEGARWHIVDLQRIVKRMVGARQL